MRVLNPVGQLDRLVNAVVAAIVDPVGGMHAIDIDAETLETFVKPRISGALSRELIDVRPEVAAFAVLMERKLREHDDRCEHDDRSPTRSGWRPGWKNDDPEALMARLTEEANELHDALADWRGELTRVPDYGSRGYRSSNPDGAAKHAALEAVDVANFAMMIADVLGLTHKDGMAL